MSHVHPTLLALAEIVLLAGGAAVSVRFVRRVGRGDRKVVVMAAMAAWLVLFGLLPFGVFAALLRPGTGQPAGPVEGLVLNAVPLALVISPVLGLVHGLTLTGRRSGGA